MANTFDLILWTDKLDYAPGDTATFTIEGAAIGGTVELQVLHVTDPGDDGVFGTPDDVLDAGLDGILGTADDGYGITGEGHDPFYVTDGVYQIDFGADGIEGTTDDVIIGDQDMTANGTIVTEWYVNPDDSLNETFLLTATDTSTGEVATTSFTDGAAGIDQWANGPLNDFDLSNDGWQNGNLGSSNSHYKEGDTVPYRATDADLVNNEMYWQSIGWDTLKGGKHALDYINTFDASFDPLPPGESHPDPTDSSNPGFDGPSSTTVDTLAIPFDPNVLAGRDGIIGTADDVVQEAGEFTLYSGTIDGYLLPGANGDFGPLDPAGGNSEDLRTDDLLLKPGADNVFNTVDDQLVSTGADGFFGTADDITTTGGSGTDTATEIFLGSGVSVLAGADGTRCWPGVATLPSEAIGETILPPARSVVPRFIWLSTHTPTRAISEATRTVRMGARVSRIARCQRPQRSFPRPSRSSRKRIRRAMSRSHLRWPCPRTAPTSSTASSI